jgi:hypothetical protein
LPFSDQVVGFARSFGQVFDLIVLYDDFAAKELILPFQACDIAGHRLVASRAAPANEGGGVSPGAAVGIGLGSFALGTAVGSAANRYYAPGYYPYSYSYPAPGYYPAAPRRRPAPVVLVLQRRLLSGPVDEPSPARSNIV